MSMGMTKVYALKFENNTLPSYVFRNFLETQTQTLLFIMT